MSRTQSSEWQSWWGGGWGWRWRPNAKKMFDELQWLWAFRCFDNFALVEKENQIRNMYMNREIWPQHQHYHPLTTSNSTNIINIGIVFSFFWHPNVKSFFSVFFIYIHQHITANCLKCLLHHVILVLKLIYVGRCALLSLEWKFVSYLASSNHHRANIRSSSIIAG